MKLSMKGCNRRVELLTCGFDCNSEHLCDYCKGIQEERQRILKIIDEIKDKFDKDQYPYAFEITDIFKELIQKIEEKQ